MMKKRNSPARCAVLKRAMTLIVIGLGLSTISHAGDDPPAPTSSASRPKFAVGSEVVLKLPGMPLFDEGRVVDDGDNLIFKVERSEGARLLLVTRDQKTRGWAYEEEIVALENAIAHYDRVTVNDLRDPDSLWVLARLWLYKNDAASAGANLNYAMRSAASPRGCYLSRSLVSFRMKKFQRAIADCDTLLRLEPDHAQAKFVREQAELAKRDYGAATAALEKAFQLDSVNPFPPAGSAASPSAAEQTAASEKGHGPAADSAASAHPESHTAAEWVSIGEQWFSSQNYDKAINAYNAALNVDPKYAPAFTSRARAWKLKYYRDRELADYDEAIKLEPANVLYRIARAECLSGRGRHELAMAEYAEALRIEPTNPAIWVSRGEEWRKDLKVNAAIADFNEAIRLVPSFAPAYIARGNIYKQINRFDLAIQSYSDLIRISPNEALAHQLLARILATARFDQTRNGKLALDEANRACELAHWIDPDAIDTLAAACAETGDFQSAVNWQNFAIRLIRQRYPSALQKKAISSGSGRGGVGFEDRLAFYKSNKPIRE